MTKPPRGLLAPPGHRGARLVDIAAAAGVYHSTVSRVLNGDPAQSVRPETYQRIMRAARQQGYRPNALARALKQSRAGAIVFVIPLLRNPIWARVQRGALRQAAERGYFVMMMEEPTEAPAAARGLPLPDRRDARRRPAAGHRAAGARARQRTSPACRTCTSTGAAPGAATTS